MTVSSQGLVERAALNRVARKNAERRKDGYVYSQHTCSDIDVVLALAKSRDALTKVTLGEGL